MNHKIAYEEINYENSDYELDVWSSCFNPIFNPPPEVIEEWNHRFDDEWKEPEPTLENTSVYFTEDGVNYPLRYALHLCIAPSSALDKSCPRG